MISLQENIQENKFHIFQTLMSASEILVMKMLSVPTIQDHLNVNAILAILEMDLLVQVLFIC